MIKLRCMICKHLEAWYCTHLKMEINSGYAMYFEGGIIHKEPNKCGYKPEDENDTLAQEREA